MTLAFTALILCLLRGAIGAPRQSILSSWKQPLSCSNPCLNLLEAYKHGYKAGHSDAYREAFHVYDESYTDNYHSIWPTEEDKYDGQTRRIEYQPTYLCVFNATNPSQSHKGQDFNLERKGQQLPLKMTVNFETSGDTRYCQLAIDIPQFTRAANFSDGEDLIMEIWEIVSLGQNPPCPTWDDQPCFQLISMDPVTFPSRESASSWEQRNQVRPCKREMHFLVSLRLRDVQPMDGYVQWHGNPNDPAWKLYEL
ncbi:hypothetical protein BDV28DRAFT_149077 [Aspergillus coremiiformis]|uniref:Ubiquitin 3 binding protein But2 C-terminal domain-containing protein n=1 Tax=Aspergillus coremiiformis TaxID=138285 RepID=A0A5N6Z419_9EURO|nr:hypothetical protein BDV28DRAFT_149077 [Aspergillus coremiiformis]